MFYLFELDQLKLLINVSAEDEITFESRDDDEAFVLAKNGTQDACLRQKTDTTFVWEYLRSALQGRNNRKLLLLQCIACCLFTLSADLKRFKRVIAACWVFYS